MFAVYRTIKRLGIPDSRIVLMVADSMACEAQNPRPAQVLYELGGAGGADIGGPASPNARYVNTSLFARANVYGTQLEVDYRGQEVTAEALLRVLTGRHHPGTPNSRKLLTDAGSNVLIYLTGHGGDEFFKFQDAGEISSYDLADAFHSMYKKGRYREMLVIADTCQANTLQLQLKSPGIIMIGSSRKGQNSWSKGTSALLGCTMIDRFTDATLRFFDRRVGPGKGAVPSLQDLFSFYDPAELDSQPGWTVKTNRSLSKIPVTDFFASSSPRVPTSVKHMSSKVEDVVLEDPSLNSFADSDVDEELPQVADESFLLSFDYSKVSLVALGASVASLLVIKVVVG